MFTNTFAPHIGGVRRSIELLTAGLQAQGLHVLIVAPSFEGQEEDTPGVIRVPAIEHIYGTDYSLPIPFGCNLTERIEAFAPDVVHAHHPFLLGATALRLAAMQSVPIVYTYHTRYEFYGHHLLPQSDALSRALRSLSYGYCNLCDAVIAPSESIAGLLREEQISVPIRVIPTGIDIAAFDNGQGACFRRKAGIPASAFLVGHVGRLSEEKNLRFLADALVEFLSSHKDAYAAIGGDGILRTTLQEMFEKAAVAERVIFTGVMTGHDLADLLAAMDIFVFASHSETQGLVLQEAMAAGCPVMALDAPGAREAVTDYITGRLLPAQTTAVAFAAALSTFAHLPDAKKGKMRSAAKQIANTFTVDKMVADVLQLYRDVVASYSEATPRQGSEWDRTLRGLAEEQRILSNIFHALGDAVTAKEAHHV